MHKKIEDAAIEHALDKMIVKCPSCGMDSLWNNHANDFKAGAEFALREAIDILKVYKLSSNAIHELEQLLSSEDKNAQP